MSATRQMVSLSDYNHAVHRFGSAMLSTMRTINGRPERLAAGNVISDLQPGMLPRANTGFFTRTNYGNWLNNANNNPITGYFGFSFVDFNGDRHYGWMQLEIKDNREVGNIPVNPYLKMLAWGYNTQPNAAITAGQTAPGGACVLPVELTSFQALPQKAGIRLHWRTETEDNNAGFELQRSEDGQKFHTLHFIEGAGTTVEPQAYSFEDETVRPGQNYFYRLKQTDYNGAFQYSKVVTGKLAATRLETGELFPNPAAGGQTQIKVTLPQADALQLTLFDQLGKSVRTESHPLDQGDQLVELSTGGLTPGIYFLKLETGQGQVYRKLIVP